MVAECKAIQVKGLENGKTMLGKMTGWKVVMGWLVVWYLSGVYVC
jgi:hypothetical protein